MDTPSGLGTLSGLDTLGILERLVGFDTTSRNSNLELIEWVETYLGDLGVASSRVPDAAGVKAGLVAQIGPSHEGGVVLCGHTDTVPVDGQPWTRPPFALSLSDDGTRAYGRGTTDMKGFIAASLAAVPTFLAADLQRPVILALSYDEEVGCHGAPALARHLTTMPPVAAVVIGEPTSMQVVQAHKGVRVLRTTVTGLDAHSSRTDLAVSAVMAAARLVTYLEDTASRLAAEGVHNPAFTPPYTTINVGTIAGGQALNIVPRTCSFVWEYRGVPGEDIEAIQRNFESFARDEILPRLLAVTPDASIETSVTASIPALDPSSNLAVRNLLQSLGIEGSDAAIAFGTDGSILQEAGMPVAVCGPGSMMQGHQPDEFISLEELDACDRFMARLAASLAGAPAADADAADVDVDVG